MSSTLLGGPASVDEFQELKIDPDLREFWSVARSADLFKDEKFGQWGLKILSPEQAKLETEKQIRERPLDFSEADLVIGTFYGDSDLLVMTHCKGRNDFEIIVSTPLDSREVWASIASSFSDFLAHLSAVEGDKYWERRDF
ncbi:MAG TPA: SMI1/KNR4 family protein [Micropepsaceae bacterium]|nr:SMI1/KNR4 family protein [Micropepsaceae bacterium]